MTKDTYEESMRKFLQGFTSSEHAEAAKALSVAMLADVIRDACYVFATTGGERLNTAKHVKRVKEDRLKRLVDKQAEDPALWFDITTPLESRLQKALRKLHAAIVGEALRECATGTLNEKKTYTEEDVNKVERWFTTLDKVALEKAQEAIDETIHDLYSNLASAINNQGLYEQVKFVFEQCGDEAWDVLERTWDEWELTTVL